MNSDITVACGSGLVNIRVGAILVKNGRILMVGNDRSDYYYSVGGRIKFGEDSKEAVEREVFEETGVRMTADRLGFVHENYFYGDSPTNLGKVIYEISFFYYMNVPDDFEPVSSDFTEDGAKEHLVWVSPDTEKTIYPYFFRDAVFGPHEGVIHCITDDRKN